MKSDPKRKISLSRVYHTDAIDRRILQVVHSGNFILGPECAAFEQELAAYIGVRHCVLASSWTAAALLLHTAQNLRPGDEVLVPSLTAFPTIEPLIHCGAVPVFCDIGDDYCIDLADAARKLTPRTVGLIPVHLYGRPADLRAARELCAAHNLWLFEDCAQSLGARFGENRTGALGDVAALSFYPSKNLTVYGDGGALLTNNPDTADLVRRLRNHGRAEKYLHEHVGFNLRFNEIQAAVGREHLAVLDSLNDARRDIAARYRRELAGLPGLTLPPADSAGVHSVYHLFVVRLDPPHPPESRDALASHLRSHGIETGVHYPVPNHLQPAVVKRFGPQPPLPRTEDACKRILSLPIYPGLSDDDVSFVAAQVREFLTRKPA